MRSRVLLGLLLLLSGPVLVAWKCTAGKTQEGDADLSGMKVRVIHPGKTLRPAEVPNEG